MNKVQYDGIQKLVSEQAKEEQEMYERFLRDPDGVEISPQRRKLFERRQLIESLKNV